MTKIVVSYRRNDTKWLTSRICEHLESRFGAGNVFLDIDSIPIGMDFREHIRQTLDACDILVAVVGPKWLERDDAGDIDNDADWVRLEISTALARKIPIVPLLIDGTKMPKVGQLPEELREFAYKQAGTFNSEDFRNQITRFIGLLDKLIQTDPTLKAKSQPEASPTKVQDEKKVAEPPSGARKKVDDIVAGQHLFLALDYLASLALGAASTAAILLLMALGGNPSREERVVIPIFLSGCLVSGLLTGLLLRRIGIIKSAGIQLIGTALTATVALVIIPGVSGFVNYAMFFAIFCFLPTVITILAMLAFERFARSRMTRRSLLLRAAVGLGAVGVLAIGGGALWFIQLKEPAVSVRPRQPPVDDIPALPHVGARPKGTAPKIME